MERATCSPGGQSTGSSDTTCLQDTTSVLRKPLPLYATDFHDLPPVVLVTAGFDPLLDEGHTYGEKLKESGVAVSERCGEGMMHGFITSRGLMPQANECLNWIVAEVGALTTSSLK